LRNRLDLKKEYYKLMNAARNVFLFSFYALPTYIARRLNVDGTRLKDVSLKSNFCAEI